MPDIYHNNINWKKYIEKTSTNETRDLLVEALPLVKSRGSALDIGAGALNESKYLLAEGFHKVTAIDADPSSAERAKSIDSPNFSFFKTTYEGFSFPEASYDLINAQYSLSFMDPKYFQLVMPKILASLKQGGVISCNLFGIKDAWNIEGTQKTFLTAESVRKIFNGLKIIKFEEKENDKGTALGAEKHWHLFDVIALKE